MAPELQAQLVERGGILQELARAAPQQQQHDAALQPLRRREHVLEHRERRRLCCFPGASGGVGATCAVPPPPVCLYASCACTSASEGARDQPRGANAALAPGLDRVARRSRPPAAVLLLSC